MTSQKLSWTNKANTDFDEFRNVTDIGGNEIGMATPDYTPGPRQRPLIDSRRTKEKTKRAPQLLSRKGCYNARKWCVATSGERLNFNVSERCSWRLESRNARKPTCKSVVSAGFALSRLPCSQYGTRYGPGTCTRQVMEADFRSHQERHRDVSPLTPDSSI